VLHQKVRKILNCCSYYPLDFAPHFCPPPSEQIGDMNSDATSLENRTNIEANPAPPILTSSPPASPNPALAAAELSAETTATATPNGRQCEEPDCEKKAKGSAFSHGGGKRCEEPGCNKSAQGASNRCVGHGDSLRCRTHIAPFSGENQPASSLLFQCCAQFLRFVSIRVVLYSYLSNLKEAGDAVK